MIRCLLLLRTVFKSRLNKTTRGKKKMTQNQQDIGACASRLCHRTGAPGYCNRIIMY